MKKIYTNTEINELITQMKEGNDKKQLELWDIVINAFYKYLNKNNYNINQLRNEKILDDIISELYILFTLAIKRYDPTSLSFMSYIVFDFRTATNRFINKVRFGFDSERFKGKDIIEQITNFNASLAPESYEPTFDTVEYNMALNRLKMALNDVQLKMIKLKLEEKENLEIEKELKLSPAQFNNNVNEINKYLKINIFKQNRGRIEGKKKNTTAICSCGQTKSITKWCCDDCRKKHQQMHVKDICKCGREKLSTSTICQSCKQKEDIKPSKQELEKALNELSLYKVAQKYLVTRMIIKGWAKRYGIINK